MELERWIRKMRKTINECPPGYWLFAADNGLFLMKYGPDGGRVLTPSHDGAGAMDQSAVITKFTGPEIDGGDW